MSERVPELVTLHVWRVPLRRVPAALARVAVDYARAGALPGVSFARLLGTGSGHTFTPRDAQPRRWALLVAWASRTAADSFDRSPFARRWHALAEEACRLDLRPLRSRGRWSRREPFGEPRGGHDWAGPVAVLTRARLAPHKALAFWRAAAPVSADLRQRAGLRLALGIGEAPVGLQGTFSVWDGPGPIHAFAYQDGPHAEVVRRTPVERWYAEQLFARFAVLAGAGTVDGRAVVA